MGMVIPMHHLVPRSLSHSALTQDIASWVRGEGSPSSEDARTFRVEPAHGRDATPPL